MKELRAQRQELQEKRDKLLGKMNNETAHVVNLKAIEGYVSDLKGLLESAPFLEQKAFLRSFIPKIDSPCVIATLSEAKGKQ